MHHLRHKNILKTIRKLAEIDPDIARFLKEKITLNSTKAADPMPSITATADDFESLDARVKKTGPPETPSRRQEVEAFSKHDTDFISNAIHLEVHEGKGAWKGISNSVGAFSSQDEPKDAEPGVQDSEEAKSFGSSPTLKQLRRDKKIMSFMKSCHIHGNHRKLFHKKSTMADPYDGLDPEIFERLGINVTNPHKNSSARKDLVRKLIVQLKDDIGIQAQEKAEAQTRADGFWVWAGRAAYHIIMENRENIDWATGVRRSAPNEKRSSQFTAPLVINDDNEPNAIIKNNKPNDTEANEQDDKDETASEIFSDGMSFDFKAWDNLTKEVEQRVSEPEARMSG